ncbi:hypothetical protein J1N35_034348 [Gossypium stocksii]|uniref:Uncharacterized protein n=1 Tax=Gossypium stocksii TaxID=47602 RepID=A0A9D3URU6_9ROSI|nr:hypothetical protein J1N35_034348 [Gossypium stocksii]
MPNMKFLSQIEAERKHFIFDPKDQCSTSLFKGFENWDVVNSQMPCDYGLLPSKNLLIHCGKVTSQNGILLKKEGMQITYFLSKPFVALGFLETILLDL